MDRRLIIVSVIGTIIIVALAVSLGVVAWKYRGIEDRIKCETEECLHTVSKILKNMNPQADPCVDFYEFACGKFEKSTTIPDDQNEVNIFLELQDELQKDMKSTIEEPISPDEPRPFKMSKNLYKTCMDTDAIKETGLRTLNKTLKDLGGWPVLLGDNWKADAFDWVEITQKCLTLGYMDGFLITLNLGVEPKNSMKRVIVLDQAKLSLPRDDLMEGMKNMIVEYYWKYMVDIAVALGANREKAEEELRESLEFEMKLANITWSEEARRNLSGIDNTMPISELNKLYPIANWERVFNGILPPNVRLGVNDTVNVMMPSYIAGFEKIIKNTPKKTVANYVLWRVVAESVKYLTEDLREIKTRFEVSATSSDLGKEPRWKECLDTVSGAMPISTAALYVRNHFKGDAKETADEMMINIRNGFVEILEQAEWMDEETRKSALEKVDSMVSHIAFPYEFRDDKKLEEYYASVELESNDFLGNILNLSIFESNYQLKLLNKPVNKTDWITHGSLSATVNAFYDTTENSIQVPAGILQGGIFRKDSPRYVNYGAIGAIIGHEITHGFDNEGSLYDKKGNLVDWWNPETKEKYLKNAECIIHQYGNYTVPSGGLNLDGFSTQGENIADNGGLKQAYLAYKKWAKQHGPELKLPGYEYTPDQLFWISAAHVWCVKIRPEQLEHDINTDVHSPGRFRVIGSFSNRPEFSADFNCKPGSPMNPAEKCSLW